MKEPILVALIVLFIAVLILRMIKAYLFAKRLRGDGTSLPKAADAELARLVEGVDTPQRSKESIRAITHQALGVKSPPVRGAYYCAAGNLAIHPLKRPGLAVGFYLKALRADPTCIEALRKLQDLLSAQKRFRRLEMTYWEVLARLDDCEVGEAVWVVCWSGLAAVYSASPRTVRRADAIRKALSAFVTDSDEEDSDGISNVPTVAP
jgi:hypothetical protein